MYLKIREEVFREIKHGDISPDALQQESDASLKNLHAQMHRLWEDQSIPRVEVVNAHLFILNEIASRDIEFRHSVRDELDRRSKKIVKDSDKKELLSLFESDTSTDLYESEINEAFHIRGTHWLPVPSSGPCPATHPSKLKFPGTDSQRCFTASAARVVRARESSHAVEKLTNERSKLRPADENNPGERCGFCQYFVKPNVCKIVDGPVEKDQVCDWIQSREVNAPTYEVDDQDWEAFGRGMIMEQPYQHIVRDVAITPEGPVVMIEDTAKPKPHRFSLTKEFHIDHTSFEHSWTQEEVDRLIEIGQTIRESAMEVPENVITSVEGLREFLAGRRGNGS